MHKLCKKITCIISVCTVLCALCGVVYADDLNMYRRSTQVDTDVSAEIIKAPSGILVEQTTGEVLYEHNPDERMNIASVTKTMTMLLIEEALDNGKISKDDMVTVSEYAAGMGGSQVFLEVGEQMSVDEMLKAIAVASGNDAAVAMAEFISGSEQAFVEKMNERAGQLGCVNTHFINCNGLDETADHYSSARDVARISCELLKHPDILNYTTIWMDSLRGGQFGLSNTNKLIRFYNGANGIKTGSTSTAKYCLSASAMRDDMQLVAVILGAPSTADRFSSASALLDYGFANYSVVSRGIMEEAIEPVEVIGGTQRTVEVEVDNPSGFIVKKGNQNNIEKQVQVESQVSAPVEVGQKLGEIVYTIDGVEAARRDIVASVPVDRINPVQMFMRMTKQWLGSN